MYNSVNNKIYDKIIIKLKVIKYKKNFFYYLSSQPIL